MSYITYTIKGAANGVIVEVNDPASRMWGGYGSGQPYIFDNVQNALLFITEKEEQIARSNTLTVEE